MRYYIFNKCIWALPPGQIRNDHTCTGRNEIALSLSDDDMISRESNGEYNEDYCKWCYADGKFAYESKDALLDFLVSHMPNPDGIPADDLKKQYDGYLSQLKHWK